jgi:RNA polymerase sigma-70 factor (ECF subfamily)
MPLDPTQAAALVRRCQRELPGETNAFEELVAAYKGRVYTIAYRMLGDQQEAEDLAQEVFLKMFRSLKSLDEPQTVTAWISRIATNTALSAIDARRRRPQTVALVPSGLEDDQEELRYADTQSLSPEEQAERREVWRCLERTLATMEPAARATLILRDIEDWSYQELANHLEVGLSAVKMRIHRARLSFQQLLERVCPDVARRGVEPA